MLLILTPLVMLKCLFSWCQSNVRSLVFLLQPDQIFIGAAEHRQTLEQTAGQVHKRV